MTDLTKIYRDRCDAVGGNLVAGKFLHKLARWQHYTKITRDGFKWVAHTHAQWAEQTELTVDQIRRTLTRLGKEGLIVREQHIFRNKTVLFVRLSTSCLEALAPTQVAQFGAAQDAHDGATHIKPFKKPEK